MRELVAGATSERFVLIVFAAIVVGAPLAAAIAIALDALIARV